MTFLKHLFDGMGGRPSGPQAVGTYGPFKMKGTLRHAFQIVRTAGADRVVKVLISVNDLQWTDSGLVLAFDANNVAMAKLEELVSSLKIDVSGGTTGTYDVWEAGSDS